MTEWRCFHCDEVFTDRKLAQDHFGIDELCLPACKVEPNLSAMLRMQEEELRQYRMEDTASYRTFHALGAKHYRELREAEEKGYEKGLKDGIELKPSRYKWRFW